MSDERSRPKKITLADVGRMAGVASMTVSRYLNGHANITDETARRVKAAIDALGYRPNQAARMLMGQPSKVIGLILPNLANPFFSSIAHSVQQTAHSKGYLVWIAATNDDPANDLQLIQRMRDNHVDGILLTASPTTRLTAQDMDGVPFIALDRPVAGTLVDFVTIDDRTAARDAVKHLLSHGYKRVACLGPDPSIHSIRERITGYQEAMREHGLTPMPYVQSDDTPATMQAVRKMMSGRHKVEAIFPANAVATVLTLEALSHMKIQVPEQVALFSYGDVPLADIFRPKISAVRQPTEQLGEKATKFLLDLIATKAVATGTRVSLPASLIIRESCGCAVQE